MVTQIGNIANIPQLIVRLGTTGPIPIRVGQNIMSLIGEASHGPAMVAMDFTSSKEVMDTYQSGPLARGGQLAFRQGLQAGYFVRVMGTGYATATYQLGDGATPTPNNAGLLTAANSGVVGNSLRAVFADGTFWAHDVEYFPGDGTVGPYYLKQNNLVGPWPATGTDKNTVSVDGTAKTCVYTPEALVAGKVQVNKATGSLTFFAGEEPSVYAEIECNIAYKTKKLTLSDGDVTYPVIDNLSDQVAIEAALMNSYVCRYDADPVLTHLPANGTYKLTGGLDGGAIDADDWDAAIWVLRDKLKETLTGTTTIALTTNMVTQDDSYDLIPMLDGHLREMEQAWMPCVGFIGMKQNENESTAIQVVSPYSNRNLVVIANPWGGERQEPRTNGWIAQAAIVAKLPLGDSSAERSSLNAMGGMAGLLNVYRDETVQALQNRRLEVLVKEDAGLYPNWDKGTAYDWQFMDIVDNVTVNYILTALYYVSKRFFFKKNTPSVRSDLKLSIAQMLNELLTREVIMKYTLDVKGPGDKNFTYTDNGRVNIDLQVENIGHIKQIYCNYDVGIIEGGTNVITLNTLQTGTGAV